MKQRTLAYLGRYDNVEDAWMNADGQKRRARLARYRNPADIIADEIYAEQERKYKHMQRRGWYASASAIRILLPMLPPMSDLPQGTLRRYRRRRRA